MATIFRELSDHPSYMYGPSEIYYLDDALAEP